MTAPGLIDGLGEIAGAYDVVLSDVWGVIHNGREAFPAACEALARFRAQGGKVLLISNSPRLAADVRGQLLALGATPESWDDIVTSGDATRVFLGELAPGPAWKIGPDRDETLYAGLGMQAAGPQDAVFISCTGPYNDEAETPEDYRARFEIAVARDLEMICANPDIVVQRGDKLIYCGGALADLYATMGGRVRMAGKPHAPIYQRCLQRAAELIGSPVDRRRVLCLGDAVATDVRGANQQGLDILFVADGIHGGDLIKDGIADADVFDHMLGLVGGHAEYLAPILTW